MMVITTEIAYALRRAYARGQRLNAMCQVAIFVFGVTAVWLAQSPDPKASTYACLFGLLSQPFFMYSTIRERQWGMFALTLVYTVAWARGLNTYWLGWF